jgi:hypothetical protein
VRFQSAASVDQISLSLMLTSKKNKFIGFDSASFNHGVQKQVVDGQGFSLPIVLLILFLLS